MRRIEASTSSMDLLIFFVTHGLVRLKASVVPSKAMPVRLGRYFCTRHGR